MGEFRPYLGYFALLGKPEDGGGARMVTPSGHDYAEGGEHLRSRLAKLQPAGPVGFCDDKAEKPLESVARSLMGDDSDPHRAELRIELSTIDALLDQLNRGARAFFLGGSKTSEHDPVIRVRERAHNGLLTRRLFAKQ